MNPVEEIPVWLLIPSIIVLWSAFFLMRHYHKNHE